MRIDVVRAKQVHLARNPGDKPRRIGEHAVAVGTTGTRARSAMGWLVLVLPLVSACRDAVFDCTRDSECRDGGRTGVCTTLGYCAFEDPSCPTELEYGELAPPSIAGTCVPGGIGMSSGTVGDESGSGTPSTSGVDTSAVSESSAGTSGCMPSEPCVPDDPCAKAGLCDGTGTCMPVTQLVCDAPPSDCYMPLGVCMLGECEYTPRDVGAPCADTDACTEGDTCDGAGACTAGAICPNDNACQVATCTDDACVIENVADGTSCGMAASARCCGGACVDISSDTAHCGGCNTPCWEGLECESVSETSSCELAPEATSGRCRCQGFTSQCPLGQLCRTVEPYVDRCVPPDSSNCDDTRFGQNSCPSYCGYD